MLMESFGVNISLFAVVCLLFIEALEKWKILQNCVVSKRSAWKQI